MSLRELPDLTGVRAIANKAIGSRDALTESLESSKKRIKELENEAELLELVAKLIRHLVDAEVTDGVKAVEKLQTEGLQEIFYNQNLAVRAEVEESRGKVAVTLLTATTLENGAVVEGVADQSFGGSVLTMQSILMRITVIFRRDMRPLLLLDETMVAVANKYVDRAARFLSTLCKRLGLDILLITHDEALVSAAHRGYFVTNVKNKARFSPISSPPKGGKA
jgi:ABC-type dipeptide/oligopeptide/nickel transport system ATPase component